MAFCTSAQSPNKSEFLIYAFILENLNKFRHRYKVPTSLNIIKLTPASKIL